MFNRTFLHTTLRERLMNLEGYFSNTILEGYVTSRCASDLLRAPRGGYNLRHTIIVTYKASMGSHKSKLYVKTLQKTLEFSPDTKIAVKSNCMYVYICESENL